MTLHFQLSVDYYYGFTTKGLIGIDHSHQSFSKGKKRCSWAEKKNKIHSGKHTHTHTHAPLLITHVHTFTSFLRREIPFLGRQLQRQLCNEVWLTDAHLEKEDKHLSHVLDKELLTCWGAVGTTGGDTRVFSGTQVLTYCSGPETQFPQAAHALHISVTVSEHTGELVRVICLQMPHYGVSLWKDQHVFHGPGASGCIMLCAVWVCGEHFRIKFSTVVPYSHYMIRLDWTQLNFWLQVRYLLDVDGSLSRTAFTWSSTGKSIG